MKDKKIIALIILVLISIIALIGSSYALLTKSFKSEKLSMQVGTLKIDFTDGNIITMNNALPMTDEDGMNTTPYTFTITNSGNIDAYYTVSNEEELTNTLDTSYLKMRLTSDNGYDSGVKKVKNLGTETYKIVDETTLATGKSVTYKLYLWISSEAGNDIQDKVYKSKIVVSSTSNRVGDTYCKDKGFTTLSDCMLVITNHEKSVEEAKTNIKAKGTPDFSQIATTDEGLYMAEDDEGESYYYRGAVKNNYVSFAGFIWRIIRRNGDGSVRMIYSGKSTSDTGSESTIGYIRYDNKYFAPMYVGYKYSDKVSLHEDNSGNVDYYYFTNTTKYDFGTSYTFDESTKKFTLTGNIRQLTWNDNYNEIVNNKLYSCLNSECNVVYKVTGYSNATTMIVQPITYNVENYQDTLSNKVNSNIKSNIDEWYKTNIINYSSYLADETFCNNRSILSGSGYKEDEETLYQAKDNLENAKFPKLKCDKELDKFSQKNGQAKLDYPVALITADEVAMAGAITGETNSKYYLYNNQDYWTMTPSNFSDGIARVNIVFETGSIVTYCSVADHAGVRPVINLKQNVTISKGDGTTLNPFVVAR